MRAPLHPNSSSVVLGSVLTIVLSAAVITSCASTPDLAVKPGDRCRVAWLRKDGTAALELVNRARADTDASIASRSSSGPTKIMRDAEMALLVDELGQRHYFERASTTAQTGGSSSSLCVEINATRWTFPSLVITGGKDAATDYTQCVRAVQDAFNHTWSLQRAKVTADRPGRDYFEAERERVERENQQQVKDAVRRSGAGTGTNTGGERDR